MNKSLTAVIRKENGGYFSLCPEIDVASQGDTIEEAKENLKEAVSLFFECASKEEIDDRLGQESYVSALEVEVA
ncbi:MAG: type II toxin-antitoxin system HicB family antitoxin [Verrucomicrobiota bacterium]